MKNMEKEPRRISRRNFIKGSIAVGGTVAVLGATEAFAILHDKNLLRDDGLTGEQKEARKLFTALSDENFVHNLVAVGETQNEKTIKVNLRNKPETPADKDDFSFGKIVGNLEPQVAIEKALVVLGNDPKVPFDRRAKDLWYAFPNPKNPDEIVFAHNSVFDPSFEKLKVPAFDLKK